MSASLRSGVVRDHCLAPERVDAPIYGGRYRPLFEDLPPLRVDERRAARARPARRTVRPRRGPPTTPTPSVAAVWPFFGQFIAHDITADRSPLAHRADPARIRNFRVPKANLEGVYGAGPVGSPYLYAQGRPGQAPALAAGSDVPRNHEGIALIGDPRNDVHLFTSQMPVAFIELHNGLVDRLRDDGVAEPDVFEEARRAATWHYQHVILREFLPGLIGAELTAELLDERPAAVSRRRGPLHPVRVRRRRLPLRPRPDPRPLPGQRALRPVPGVPRPDGLRPGRARAHGRLGAADRRRGPRAGPARQAHRRAAARPADRAADPDLRPEPGTDYASLANRDLQRGQAVGLASGEAVARRLGVPR